MDQTGLIAFAPKRSPTLSNQGLEFQTALYSRCVLAGAAVVAIAVFWVRPWIKPCEKGCDALIGCGRTVMTIIGAFALLLASALDIAGTVLITHGIFFPSAIPAVLLPAGYLGADLLFTTAIVVQILRVWASPRPWWAAVILALICLLIFDSYRWGTAARLGQDFSGRIFNTGADASYTIIYALFVSGMLVAAIRAPYLPEKRDYRKSLTIAAIFILWLGRILSVAFIYRYIATKTWSIPLFNAANAARDIICSTKLIVLALLSWNTHTIVRRRILSGDLVFCKKEHDKNEAPSRCCQSERCQSACCHGNN